MDNTLRVAARPEPVIAPDHSILGRSLVASSRGGRLLTWSLAAGGMLLFGLALLADPATSGLFPECPFRLATGGLSCPGCGTLRALHQLGHGNLGAALALNPIAVLALPLVLLGLGRALLPKRADAPPRSKTRLLGWAALALILAWWLTRNLLGA
jgi:hypothetical protein